MRLRRTAPLAAIAASALVLAACGGGDDGSSTGDDGEQSGTVNFYTDKAAWEPQFQEVSDLSADSIGLSMEFTGYSDANQYDAFIRQSFRTDEKPDLFTWHTGSKLEELVGEDLLEPTSDIWAEAIENGDATEDLKQYFTVGDEQYCVPTLAAYWVMYYNTAVFEEHGITPPTTWDDLIAAADTLVAAGVTPFYQTNILFSFVWFQTLLAGSDPELYNDLASGDASYTDEGVVEVMELWGDMIDKGYFQDPGVQTDPQTLLKNGDVAMVNFGTFLSGQLNSIGAVAGTDYDFFVVPNVNPDLDKTVLPFETGPLCTAANATNLDEAKEYAQWWMGEEAQTAWSNARGDVSFNPNAKVNDESLADLNEQAGTDDIQLVNRYFEATPTPILTAALDGFGAFVSNGGDPMPILETIQAEADAYWSSQG
ncbi:MAG TPA: extracellular solute-binding protein [Jiangellaceae bacterium]